MGEVYRARDTKLDRDVPVMMERLLNMSSSLRRQVTVP